MRRLRGLWEGRLRARGQFGEGPPAVGLREERAYVVFPKAFDARGEVAARRAYLGISRELLRRRYGSGAPPEALPEHLLRRAEKDRAEYEALEGR